MKKTLVFLAVFLVAIMTVSAQQLTLSDVNLGGISQDRDETTTATLTITNNGASNITSISLTESGVDAAFGLNLSLTTIAVLTAGQSTTVTVETYVPENFDAGNAKIGTISASGTDNTSATVTATSDINLEAENNLEIRDVEVIVNGEDESLDDGDDVEVFPYADVEVIIELKNTHSTYDIEDIEVTVIGEDDLDDIDEDDEISKIKDGKKDSISFTFSIDEDASEGNYDIEILVEGEDEEGAMHGEEWTITFELEEEGIFITRAELSPESLICGQNSFDLKVELTNVGDRDEDEAAIEIVASSLNFEKRVSNLEIEEDDEITKTYTITVPEDVSVGTHVIELEAFMDFDEETHSKNLYFNVPSGCSATVDEEDEEEEEEETGIIIETGNVETQDDVEFVDMSTGTDKKSSTSSLEFGLWGTVLLVLANLLVLLIIVILIIKFLVRV